MKKVLFMGTPDYAKKILEKLIGSYEIVGVYTQPDRPVGRKRVLTASPVKELASKYDLKLFQPENLKNETEIIKSLKPDFIVVAAFGQILPKEILEIAPSINLHASLLPKYRGASPIQSAILNGDKWSGVTAMLMDEGLETGDILGYQYVEVGEKKAPQLFEELAEVASTLTPIVIDNFDKIVPLKQNSALSSYSPKIKKIDGKIDFDDSLDIWRRYKAFYHCPQIWTDKFKLIKIGFLENSSSHMEKGKILEIKEDSVVVSCRKGTIELFEVQPHSKKRMSILDYLNGKGLKVGDNLL